jgi:hypothetical protein
MLRRAVTQLALQHGDLLLLLLEVARQTDRNQSDLGRSLGGSLRDMEIVPTSLLIGRLNHLLDETMAITERMVAET